MQEAYPRPTKVVNNRPGWLLLDTARGVLLDCEADPLPAAVCGSIRPYLPVYGGSEVTKAGGVAAEAEAEALQLLDRGAEIADGVGRWCAANRHGWQAWDRAHSELEREADAMHKRLRALGEQPGGGLPPELERHIVALALRLAQVAHACAAGSWAGLGWAPQRMVARHQAAFYLLWVLHGFKSEGAARAAAVAECGRLGAEMDAAWRGFPEAEREALRALPWENDGEPAQAGTWRKRHGAAGQEGQPILRPPLRQAVDPALGYVPDSFARTREKTGDDKLGAAYVRGTLLPAAERALPLLEAAARAIAGQLGGGAVVRTPPLKTQRRMDEKAGVGFRQAHADHFLHEYPRQASNVDVARVMLVVPTPALAVRAHALFKSRCEVLRVKNRFSPDAPQYGYRDMLLNLRLEEGGMIVEAQIAVASLVVVRRKMHRYYGIVRSIGMEPLITMAKPLTAEQAGPEQGEELREAAASSLELTRFEQALAHAKRRKAAH
jgi:hypothetical protein